MICCFEVLLDLYMRIPQLVEVPGCVFLRNPGARDLLSVPAGCNPTVRVMSISLVALRIQRLALTAFLTSRGPLRAKQAAKLSHTLAS